MQPAAVIIDALRTPAPRDLSATVAYLEKLTREWALAAETLFKTEGKTLLAPRWRAVGQALECVAFDPAYPDRHASRACLEAGDWEAAVGAVQTEDGFAEQPVLVGRLAQALWQTQRTVQAIERWFSLCWSAPEYFTGLLENGHISAPLLLEHWREAINADVEPEISTVWFPAWMILHEPGLARLIKSRGATSGPQRAFDLARELVMSDDEQIEARQELKDIHPGLFRRFLENSNQLL
ncbi:MAG: hypothetical protein OXS28_10055 [Gammaproteobacteria bacterium]|nr:hypothetical protein [Gammaproteobacteria bacterium]